MLAFWIVEHLDVLEHILPRDHSGQACAAPDAFALQQLEEAFRDCVVMTVAPSAHAGIQIMPAERRVPLAAGDLRSLIGMDHHPGLGLAPPDGGEQGLQGERFGAYHSPDTWTALLQQAQFEPIEHYYRPKGLPRHQQPWFVSVWRKK